MSSTTYSIFTQFKAIDGASAPLKQVQDSTYKTNKAFDKLRSSMKMLGGAFAIGGVVAGLKMSFP